MIAIIIIADKRATIVNSSLIYISLKQRFISKINPVFCFIVITVIIKKTIKLTYTQMFCARRI